MVRTEARAVRKLLIVSAALCGIYYAFGEYRISRYLNDRATFEVRPHRFLGAAWEKGVVISKRVVDDYWAGERSVSWAIKIADTDRNWTCIWELGSTSISIGDAVELIHHVDDNGDQVDDNEGVLRPVNTGTFHPSSSAALCIVADTEDLMDDATPSDPPG